LIVSDRAGRVVAITHQITRADYLHKSEDRAMVATESYKAPIFQISKSQTPIENLKFERADWTSFRTIEGLQQKAGVAQSKLRRLVLNDLTDNALDTGAQVRIGELPGSGYFIEDDGNGIDGQPEEIARPMVSSKLLRLPMRDALGNRLRVVAEAVLASDGFQPDVNLPGRARTAAMTDPRGR
jgi:hypothetical protein